MTIWEIPRQLRRQITDRIAAGEVTQAAIARETCITQGTISNILTGRKACRMRTLYMIGEAAGIYATMRLDQVTPDIAVFPAKSIFLLAVAVGHERPSDVLIYRLLHRHSGLGELAS
jgi:transcriptional regulator with XRE-family HTH domain